jgi:hypothetical protein
MTKVSDKFILSKGQKWKMGYDAEHNEFILGTYLSKTNVISLSFKNGDDLK